MPPFALVLPCALAALLLPFGAGAAEKSAAPESTPAASTPAPAEGQQPVIEETPLLVEARKRAPKELWIEMTQIQSEMHARAQEQDYPPLSDLAKRLHADMLGSFVQVFDPLVQPRRVGLKRAVLGCAPLPARVDQAVKANWPIEIEEAMSFVDSCMKMLGRFYPPEMTGLPDEFASAKPAAEKPRSD